MTLLCKSLLNIDSLHPDNKWENMLIDIISYTKIYSINKAKKERKEKYNALKARLSKIMDRMSLGERGCHPEYEETQKKLNDITEENAASAAFRSKCTYTKDYEKSSKFFFSLEKANYNKKHMKCITKPDGSTITEPQAILDEQCRFYKELYEKDSNVRFQHH